MKISSPYDSGADGAYYVVSFVDTSSEGVTIKAGTIYNLTFTAKDDISSSDDVSFKVKRESVMDTTWVEVDADKVTAGDPVSVTVTPAPATASYKVDLEGTQTVQMGETAPVTVKIASDNATTYNAVDVMLKYDKEKLALDTTSLGEGYTITNDAVQWNCKGYWLW